VKLDDIPVILTECHSPKEGGHVGRDCTMDAVKTKYFMMVNLKELVTTHINNCLVCAVLKPKPQHTPAKTIVPRTVGHIVSGLRMILIYLL
jgi:Integrase zinc binding domain